MKKIIGILISMIIVATSLLALGACGEKDDRPVLKMATNAEFAPFEFFEGKNIVGIDVDIAKYIADKLGYKLIVEHMDFDSVLESVKSTADFDIALAGLTYNESRAEIVNFTDSYFNASQYIIVKDTNTLFDNCKTAEEINQKINDLGSSIKIGYQNATTGSMYANGDENFEFEGFKDANKKGYTSGALAVQDLDNNGIVIIDELPAKKLVEKITGVKLVNIKLTDETYAIAVNPKHTELTEKINNILKTMKENGELERIIEKYIKTEG